MSAADTHNTSTTKSAGSPRTPETHKRAAFNDKGETEMATTIDLTPTWGEWGNLYRRFAESGETSAIRQLRADFARAMAAAQALQQLDLTDEQARIVSETMTAELAKQGF